MTSAPSPSSTTSPDGATTTAPPTTGVVLDEALIDELLDGVPEHYATQPVFDDSTRQILAGPLDAARRNVRLTEGRLSTAQLLLGDTTSRVVALEGRYRDLTGQRAHLVQEAMDARAMLDERAVQSYLRGGDAGLLATLGASTMDEASRRRALTRAVLDNDEKLLVEAEVRLSEATAQVRRLVEARVDARRRHRKAQLHIRRISGELERAQFEVTAYEVGSHIVIQGFTFPVDTPTSFYDGWGAPRMTGTVWSHWHEGTDIMAPSGSALLAAENGVIERRSSNTLGGASLWLQGASGTRYYYAHLSRYEPGVDAGSEVRAGDVVGYVGDTGNARGAPHLHFEIHVDGNPVNPYPILRVAWEWRLRQIAEAGDPIPQTQTGPLPSADAVGRR